jgi:nucleoside-diphosphate-sugar epimerase
MTGMKFGATGQEALTWAMNSYLPGMIALRYRQSRIVAFSTGNVYGLSPVALGGSVESDPPAPVGEYAMSCLGRERIFEHFSRTLGIPTALLRLNYACELRYGVLVDLAQRVLAGEPVDLGMGQLNAIWQADANATALCAFGHVASPPFVLNVAGPETLSVRRVAEEFGRLLGRPVCFQGSEAVDALLSNGQLGHRLFGYPRVAAGQLIRWIADWLRRGGPTLGKPTHFEVRDGRF